MCVMYETAALLSLSLSLSCARSLSRARSLLRSSHSSPHPTREYRDFNENANGGLELRFEKLDEELKDNGGRMDSKFKALQQELKALRKHYSSASEKVRVMAGRDGRVQMWEAYMIDMRG